jgi:putative ABC transport system permease protein
MKRHTQPPKWADRFLSWFCDEALLEEIQGDLYEAYHFHLEEYGPGVAKRKYLLNVLRFFKPYAFEKYSRAKQFLPMFNNYLKIAIRNILHRKGFTTINLLGLTIGLSAVMLIVIYLKNELTYDQSAPEHQQVYRLVNHYRAQTYTCMNFPDYFDSSKETQLRLINHIREYDEVATACHFVPSESAIGGQDQYYIETEGRRFEADHVLYTNTGPAFQQIFPQTFLLGTPENAFSTYNTTVLTEKLARRWFGKNWMDQDIIGKTLTIREESFRLAAVIKDVPENVHYDFDWIIHQSTIPSWGAYTYFKLKPNTQADAVVDRLNREADLVYPGFSEDELRKGIDYVSLSDIHFTDDTLYELKPIANEAYLSTFGIVGIIILLIILTNYTNLSIAMYADRQKELGIRKVMGARPRDISFQLLAEAVLLALICFPLCLLLLGFVLPYFSELMELELKTSIVYQSTNLFILLGLLILTGLLSGLYPSLVYGKKSMVQLFGKKVGTWIGSRTFSLRNVLITSQFVMVVGLLSITFFIYQQMQYINQKDLGFQKEGVVYWGIDGAEKYASLKTALQSFAEIEAVGANGVPGQEMFNQLTYKMKGTDVTLDDGTLEYMDWGTIKTLGIRCEACSLLEQGKDSIFVINRTAAEKLARIKGITPEELIGQTLITEPEWENDEYGSGIPYLIEGIIDDFKYFSLKYPDQSLLIEIDRTPNWAYTMLARARTDDWPATIQKIKTAYREVEADRPFDLHFLEDRIDQLYTAELRSGFLLGGLSLVAIILAMMGLAGIVSYVAYSRKKEIGIRKILGASVKSILIGFNKEFIALMAVATLIAMPVALLLAYEWLDNFAFAIQPQFWVVILAGLLALFLVIIMVSIQARRTAYQEPVDVLRVS